MTTATANTALEALVSELKNDERLRPLARAADEVRRASAELRENLTQMRKQADQLEQAATTGSCFIQRTIGSGLFHDPTEWAHRTASAALAQNHAIWTLHEIGSLLGVLDDTLQELVAYICANACDWNFRI